MTNFEKTLAKLTSDFTLQVAAAISAALKKPDLGGVFAPPVKTKRKYTKRSPVNWAKASIPDPTRAVAPVSVVGEVPGPLALVKPVVESFLPPIDVLTAPVKAMDIFVSKDPEDGYFETVIEGKVFRASRKRDLKRRLTQRGFTIGAMVDIAVSVKTEERPAQVA